MTAAVTVGAVAVLGAAAGPWLRARIFAHSVAYTRPLRRFCPRCHHPLATSVTSRLPTTGRCPGCARRIGPATGAVEAAAAVTMAVLAWRSPEAGTLAAATWVAAFGIVLSYVDATVHRLPDRLTLPALAGAGLILAVTATVTSRYGHLLTAVLGSMLAGGAYLALVLARPTALGLGDAKLALITGLLLGWFSIRAAITGLIAAVLVAAVVGLALLASRRIRLRQGFAHGPAILLGALLVFATTPR